VSVQVPVQVPVPVRVQVRVQVRVRVRVRVRVQEQAQVQVPVPAQGRASCNLRCLHPCRCHSSQPRRLLQRQGVPARWTPEALSREFGQPRCARH